MRGQPPKTKASVLRAVSKYALSHHGRWTRFNAQARARNLDVDLSYDEYQALMEAPCTYCGVPAALGVDRVDSAGNYTPENCVSCCAFCNRAKWKLSPAVYREWISKVKAAS